MALAVEEARRGVEAGHGGPFGAVIVRNGEVVARAHNTVLLTKDPTAHAEINAIREASQRLGRFDLGDCVLFTTCEPCPMCLSAILWARIPEVYEGATRRDAAEAGFDDEAFYTHIQGGEASRLLRRHELARELCLGPFRLWLEKPDRVSY